MVLSETVIEAARAGNVATVEQWLSAGGDANERCPTMGKTLLHYLASDSLLSDGEERGRCDIARLLLARGAEVDAIRIRMEGMTRPPAKNTPLLSASLYNRNELCRLLLEAGADPNYKRFYNDDERPDFPLWLALDDPTTVRLLLSFGADPSQKGAGPHDELIMPEERALRWHDDELVRLLRDARLLRPRLRGVFALRALCHRGRAAPTSETPSAFARLIGSASASQPKTRAAAKIRSSPGLPDPLAHLVCLFWLGSPPRRRRVNH